MTNKAGDKVGQSFSKKLYRSQLDRISREVRVRGIGWSEAIVTHPLINRQWLDELFGQDIPTSKRPEGEVSLDIVTLRIPMLYKDIVRTFSIGENSKYRFASGAVVTFLAQEILGEVRKNLMRTFLPCFGLDIRPSQWDVTKVPTFTRLYPERMKGDDVIYRVSLEIGIQAKEILWPIGTTFVLINNKEYPKVHSKDP